MNTYIYSNEHTKSMVLADLEEWNPWWRDGKVPSELAGRPRHLTGRIIDLLGQPEVVNLVGVRRSGKSTIMYQVVERLLSSGTPPQNVLMVNFEDPALDGDSLGSILSEHRQRYAPKGMCYVLLDEVQRSKGWERWVLREYERKRPFRFLVSGSTTHVLRGELATLLTGRTRTVRAYPLTFPEYLEFQGRPLDGALGSELRDLALHHLGNYLEIGGFPRAVLSAPSSRRGLLDDYFHDIITRDVARVHGIDLTDVEALAAHILANVGNLLSLRSMGDAVSLSPNTVKAYIEHLAAAHLIVPVYHLSWKTKPTVQEQTPSKYFCIDPGLRNAVSKRHSDDSGRLLENAVCVELVRRGSKVHYWKGRREVDFVVGVPPGPFIPMNVSFGEFVPDREYDGLEEIQRTLKRGIGRPVLLSRVEPSPRDWVDAHLVWRWLLEPADHDDRF